MSTQKTKEYLKHAFELEGAIYTHQQLVDAYTCERNQNVPKEPIKNLPNSPTKVSIQEPSINLSWRVALTSVFFMVGGLLFLIPIILGDSYPMMIFGIIVILCGIGAKFLTQSDKSNYEKKCQEYHKAQNEYQLAQQEYRKRVDLAEQDYLSSYQTYLIEFQKYNDDTSKQLEVFQKTKKELQFALTELYSKNIVYAKYRNLVAIATIYEYFDSGRCTELEGPNGAYNMYEGELRSNIIICSLSQIIADLAQIKNGQYALYEQINRSNQTVCELLNNINNTQRMTAYYAEMAAVAASADSYIFGMMW